MNICTALLICVFIPDHVNEPTRIINQVDAIHFVNIINNEGFVHPYIVFIRYRSHWRQLTHLERKAEAESRAPLCLNPQEIIAVRYIDSPHQFHIHYNPNHRLWYCTWLDQQFNRGTDSIITRTVKANYLIQCPHIIPASSLAGMLITEADCHQEFIGLTPPVNQLFISLGQ